MEKQFVTYDIANKLKEIGFDNVPCVAVYYNGNEEEQFTLDCSVRETQYYASKGFRDGILAPLWQQVFEWFRSKHNLDGEIYQVLLAHNGEYKEQNTSESEYTFRINVKGIPLYQHTENISDSYEEARLKCVTQLLKLI